MNRSLSFLPLALSVLLASQGYAQVNGISLRVELDKREFLLAEPIWVRCWLINETTKVIIIPYERHNADSYFRFEIIGPDGTKLAHSWPRIDSLGPEPLTIRGGEHFVELFNLYDEYAIADAATYQVTVTFASKGKYYTSARGKVQEGKGWTGSLRSNTTQIMIANPVDETDVAALSILTPPPDAVPRDMGQPFPFLRAFSEAPRQSVAPRLSVIEKFPRSRYAPYARYFEAKDKVNRFRHSSAIEFADDALRHLGRIDSRRPEFGKLFPELVALEKIRAYSLLAEKAHELKTGLTQDFRRKYPHSPHLSAELQKPNDDARLQECFRRLSAAKDPKAVQNAREAFVAELVKRYAGTVSGKAEDFKEAAKQARGVSELMKVWNPIGFAVTDVKAILGKPTSEWRRGKGQDTPWAGFEYWFEFGTDGIAWRFVVEGEEVEDRCTITGVQMIPGE